VALGLVTAPLLTLSISMQASLPQNRVSLLDILPADANENKSRQEPTRITQLRNATMKINSKADMVEANKQMSLWRPFKPASYSNYIECMRALYKQGSPWSLYKGNLTRSVHILLFHKMNTWMSFTAESQFGQQWKEIKEIPVLPEFMLSCMVDMFL